jgi:hypothetical protein
MTDEDRGSRRRAPSYGAALILALSACATAPASSPASSPTSVGAQSAGPSEEGPSPSASSTTVPGASPSVADPVAATTGRATLIWEEAAPIGGTAHTGAWIDERWLIAGGAAGRAAVWESTDAAAWLTGPPIDPPPVSGNDQSGPSSYWISALGDWEGTLVGAGVHRFGFGDGLTMAMWTSTDGKTWEHSDLADIDRGGTHPTIAVAPDDRLIIIGAGGLGSRTFVYTTADGETWEDFQLGRPESNERLMGIAGGPPSLVGVGQASVETAENQFAGATTIWTSSDWVTWQPLVTGPLGYLSAVAYDNQNGRFVAGGGHVDPAGDPNGSPVIWLSEDGRAWAPVVIDARLGGVQDVAVMNGVILAAGSVAGSGEVVLWESTDGVTWAATPFGASGRPHLIAHDNGALLLIATCCEVEETRVWSVTSP